MADQLEPIQIDCDAPPYAIVRGCVELGLKSPQDVRWLRLDHVLGGQDKAKGFLSLQGWTAALGLARPAERTCSCGQTLPALERCTFILRSGVRADYHLGQCARCKTIFWQQL